MLFAVFFKDHRYTVQGERLLSGIMLSVLSSSDQRYVLSPTPSRVNADSTVALSIIWEKVILTYRSFTQTDSPSAGLCHVTWGGAQLLMAKKEMLRSMRSSRPSIDRAIPERPSTYLVPAVQGAAGTKTRVLSFQ
jgi:hypothetical protein